MTRITFYLMIPLLLLAFMSYPAHADTGNMRIVSLTPHITDTLFDIGAGGDIVGTPFTYDDEHHDIVYIGGFMNPSLEKIVSLKPTLIIGSSASARPELIARLKQLGYRVELVDEKSLSDIYDSILFIGKLTGKEISAKNVVDDMKSKMAQLEKSVSDKPVKTVFYQVWYRPLMSIGKETYLNEILMKAHLQPTPINSEGYSRISTEEVVKADPDIILIPYESYMNLDVSIFAREWENNHPQMKAVRTHQILLINSENLHRPGTRLTKGLQELIEVVWGIK